MPKGRVFKRAITFSVDTEDDRDLIRWIEGQGNRSDAIRSAIRAFVTNNVTLGDVYQEIADIKRLVRSAALVAAQEDGDGPEPDDPEVARVEGILDGLGL